MNVNNILIKSIISDYFKTELEAIKSVKYDKDILADRWRQYQNLTYCYRESNIKPY